MKTFTLNAKGGIFNLRDLTFRDTREAISVLRSCQNVDIDENGYTTRRVGRTKIYSGTGLHSIDPNRTGLFMEGAILKRLLSDDTAKTIATMSNSNPMVYTNIPGRGTVCSNNTDIGIVNEDSFSGFTNPAVQYKRAMPAGHILAYYRGVLYVARGSDIYYSDAHAYGVIDIRNKKKRMKSYVTMIMPVDDGMFVSDSDDTYFWTGSTPHNFTTVKIADYPAIYGINVNVEEQIAKVGVSAEFRSSSDGYPVFWESTKGTCAGKNGGAFQNLTIDKYANASGTPSNGCALFRYNNGIPQFIAVGNI